MISMPLIAQYDRQSSFNVGAVVEDALRECYMTHKETWIQMGLTDGAYLSRALQGVPGYALDLWKLANLPYRFWLAFLPLLMKAKAKAWMEEFIEGGR